MCTVTWSTHAHGYDLVFSRDELLTRSAARPPRQHTVAGVEVLYAHDPDGDGTWLLVNEFGVCLCVLNEYALPGNTAQATSRVSRGVLPIRLGHHCTLPALRKALFAMDLAAFAPFRLCAVAPGEPAFQVVWTGEHLIEKLGDAPFVTSSSYRPQTVAAARRERFDAFRARVVGRLGGEDLLRFHRSGDGDPGLAVAMRRPDRETVSVSHVKVGPDSVQLCYYAGHPDQAQGADPAERVLARNPKVGRAQHPPVAANERTINIGPLAARARFSGRSYERALLRALRWLIKERQLNEILNRVGPLRPRQFPERMLIELGVTVSVRGADSDNGETPVYVANHPLGGIDGLALLAWILNRHGEVVVPVNGMLASLPHLHPFVVGLDRGRPSRALATAMANVFQANAPVLIFPAGATSRRGSNGLQDPPWSNAFLRLADRYRRPVVPIFVSGSNSHLFYGVAKARRALGVRANLEMFLLPREMLRAHSRAIDVYIGEAETARNTSLEAGLAHRVACVRERCYALGALTTERES